ncbi:SAM-dependent methyltransferase [Pseudoxanthomonas indica]|uniref:Cyclopropane-fatty-acyl-phospholipid synthase n=1 Tax=Pseudoxanthomonas indica TaxID=428993 RepID=A0A1T5ITX0_9GAMM|nr:cyclopropane-fatty-acyl-phospholipid synthase family protein [Pseudoxanthomonas indica]GGD54261.1 cyclopropane-fatty-acyl-phospholipid synthase [Pseudoxanthomonas indica]SKC42532.1 cyclopropane-fatty-acyl-phospholipid synthase [Pseudoxanthomonas indica]
MIPSIDSVARIAPTALERWLRRRLLAKLSGLQGGRLRLRDADGQFELGQDVGEPAIDLWVDDPVFYRQVAMGGSVGAGEAYIDGAWQCSDLVALVQLLVRNRDLLDGMERGPARLAALLLRLWHAARVNSRTGSRRNIAAHYDLGNAFFALFLSADMMYSSAIFADAEESLEQASRRKLDRICRWLQLAPGDRVIEIGSGWGGFAEHAARHYGCHVTTTTISAEQYQSAQMRMVAAGLQEQVSVLQLDYRDLRGQYDKLVSIEMIEAVGAHYLPGYFAQLQKLLKPGGLALIQAITIEDHRYEQALHSVDFIKRHVFPGSFIPSLEAISRARAGNSDLYVIVQEDFGESYALTLNAWRQRFLQQLPAVRAQGFDEDFIRLWEFYLAYCEGGFRERSIGVSHLLMARPGQQPRGKHPEDSR